ncbi:MAG: ABC transporter ATP-binding protein [Candidatus Acidiferrum sp.]|jgi:phospholipid/cholesterol/gamma-HCH transport system ATP-binding protein
MTRAEEDLLRAAPDGGPAWSPLAALTPAQESAVLLRGLRKSFGSQVVLNGISLTINAGETLAMLGRSGTGKSVLLKIIIGLEKPDAGSVLVEGQDISRFELEALNEIRKKMGFLFQHAALYDSMTVAENIAFPLKRHTQMTPPERADRVEQLLTSVGLEDHLRKMPSDISGGMQKRVGLARALALDPSILLLDEPTAGLDPITSGEIDELILKLQQEHHMASLVVTHDLHSAKTIANRIALLDKGHVVIEGTFKDLEHSDNQFVSEFMQRDS